MGKRSIKAMETSPSFNFKSYSVDEILAAGGTTAFANKLGKNFDDIEERLKKLPKDAFLTDEEVEEALRTLNASK